MNFWEFLARSEWPLVVAGGLYFFRESIRRLLESIVRVKGPGVSIAFAKHIQQSTEANFKVVKLLAQALTAHDPELAAKIEPEVEKAATANNAVSSTLSGILRVTDAQDIASIRGTVGGPTRF